MRFLITAGPTREPIDPVRFLSNRSSGKMGYALAKAAADAGHKVILISGPVALESPDNVDMVFISTAEEMYKAVHARLANADVLIMAAAVADYTPAIVHSQKLKKQAGTLTLELVRTRDILHSLPSPPRKFLVVGFAAETTNVNEYAQKKLIEKKCDMIIANDVSSMNTGFASDYNEVTLHFSDGSMQPLPCETKYHLAKIIIHKCEQLKI